MSSVLTNDEYDKLKNKLEHMIEVEMPSLEKQLAAARERGDLSENAEYDAARQAIWMHEARISELREQLEAAQIIDPSKVDRSKALMGAKIVARDLDGDDEETFVLVGHIDENSHNDAVSINSPVGQALLGCRVNEVVEVDVPAGKLRLKIEEISY